MNKSKMLKNNFRQAVESTPDTAKCYQNLNCGMNECENIYLQKRLAILQILISLSREFGQKMGKKYKTKKNKLAGFGVSDYFQAAEQRYKELPELQESKAGKVLFVYICGVVVECILRGHIAKAFKQECENIFDARHNLKHLFQSALNNSPNKMVKRREINDALDLLDKRWKNNLRYYSEKKFKNEIYRDNDLPRKKIELSYNNYIDEIFSATEVLYNELKEK